MPSRRRQRQQQRRLPDSGSLYSIYPCTHTHTCVHPHFAYVCVRQSVSWQRVSIPVLDNILLFYFPFFVEMFKLHNTHTHTHTYSDSVT